MSVSNKLEKNEPGIIGVVREVTMGRQRRVRNAISDEP